ncbi:MAG: DUF167 family protein [Proteobacteria bacterium]|nr:DUF167 family protein [Pseudomonadota bacterium]MDA1023744.1 DUF167 family protein [Pseudomonadota bacterium]
MDRGNPFRDATGGVDLMVRLTPKASRNALGPVAQDGDGNAVLKAQVTAAPEDGKANAALIKMVAKSLGLPKGAISLKRGPKDRMKTLFIDIDASDTGPEELLKRLSEEL